MPEEELAPQEPDDPYAGPTLDPWRGVRKAAWRLYVFYGAFAPVVIAGLVLVWRAQALPHSAFVVAWALTYLALNLLSGGLPGPNLVRYNKDLEIVAPLFCLALASVGEWLWTRSRWLAHAVRRRLSDVRCRSGRALPDREVRPRALTCAAATPLRAAGPR